MIPFLRRKGKVFEGVGIMFDYDDDNNNNNKEEEEEEEKMRKGSGEYNT
jgi:hypothetical protein